MTNQSLVENAQTIHKFEVAGLGKAPFRFVGLTQNVFIAHPGATPRAGGSCDYCGTGIMDECHIISADGKKSKVGTSCIAKVGDHGLMKRIKLSPEWQAANRAKNAKLREKRQAKAKIVVDQLHQAIQANCKALAEMPHPNGFIDRKTGAALTALDYYLWMQAHCGDTGRAALLRRITRLFA